MSDSHVPRNVNDDGDNHRKRKERPYLPPGGEQNGPNKRLDAPKPPNAPLTGPPAQPGFVFGTQQIGSPGTLVPHPTTIRPLFAMGSTDVAPQDQQPQAQSQPQLRYPQLQPQTHNMPQPVEHQSGLGTKLTPGFHDVRSADDLRSAVSSVLSRQEDSNAELLRCQSITAYVSGSEGIPMEISASGRPGKGHVITAVPGSKCTISISSGNKVLDTIMAQYAYHHDEGAVKVMMIQVPLMSSRLPDPHQPRQPSDSTENFFLDENNVRRQVPKKTSAQIPAQTWVQSQAPPQAHFQHPDSLMTVPLLSSGAPPPETDTGPTDSTVGLQLRPNRPRKKKPGKKQAQLPPAQPPAQANPQGQ